MRAATTAASFNWTNNFDFASGELDDQNGVPLTAGGTFNGDGAVYQIGYFNGLATGTDPASVGPSLWDMFVPLSGNGSLNPSLNNSIGDLNGDPGGSFHGYVSFTTTFDTTIHAAIPGSPVRLGVRLFNTTTVAASTNFNMVTSFESGWILPSATTPTPLPALLDLDSGFTNGTLLWLGTPFMTSEALPAGPGTVIWQNDGTNWFESARWDNGAGGNAPPSPADIAAFPDAAVITQPDLNGTNQSVDGITIDNTSGVYTFSDSVGSGSLMIGASGLVAVGGGTTTMDLNLVLGADQSWDIGAGTTVSYSDPTNSLSFGNNTLTKAGAGTLILNENNYANIGAAIDVDLTAGNLVLGADPGANFMVRMGDGTMLSVLSTTLAIDRSAATTSTIEVDGTLSGSIVGAGDAILRKVGTGTATINSLISGTGGLEVNDAGDTIRLTANNAYSGSTTVAAGILLIDGDQSGASGSVVVAGSAQLGGSGVVGGATTMAAGSELAAGTDGTTGTLSFANGLDSSDSTWLVDIVSTANLDVIDVTGDLDITGATLTLSGATLGGGTPYILANYSGTLTGTFAFDNVPAGWTIDYAYGIGSSQIALIPEPGTVLPLALILTPWIMRRRRRGRGRG